MSVLCKSVELIWNKGIAAMCDRRVPDEFSTGRYSSVPTLAGAYSSSKLPDDLILDPSIFDDLQENELVWVRVSWIKSFVRQVLPRVKVNFILVTGDSDSCVPSELMKEAEAILDSTKVLHWYTQNYDGSVPSVKISALPIGIDFHMLSERPMWGERIATPEDQEESLLSLRRELLPLDSREPKVYIDFAWQKGFGLRRYRRFHPLRGTKFHENRRRVLKRMGGKEFVVCQPGPLPRTEMWRERGKCRFVLSPHGTGLDCHRTWEALALGHIVLVPSSSIDSLYTGLPVVAFKDWSEITAESLERWSAMFRNESKLEDTQPQLNSRYWIRRMRHQT